MTVFTIHQAKTNLSKLLAEVELGGEVIIARGAKPIAKLVAIEAPQPRRRAGMWKGRISLDERFFEPLPAEELALWEGESE